MHSEHYLPRSVPENLRGLLELALDLRWSWYHGQDDLWRAVDHALWEVTSNPWLIMESVSEQRLLELSGDTVFLKQLNSYLAEREEHFNAPTWFSERCKEDWSGWVAYFSMEFGLSESLPIYSGGLGVLAGDFLKTASDLGVPVIGVGLLYQQGYFRQSLDASGEQIEFYPYNDPTMLPVKPLLDSAGTWIRVPVELPGRCLQLRTWTARVGRRSLLLLDSNDPFNEPGDRGITSELYGGGNEMRLQQEIVLGIGGWRLLDMLGIECNVCHLNEGHAAFAVLERARLFMRDHECDFYSALCATRAGNLFTTHTPVSAGFDRFPLELMKQYFQEYIHTIGISFEELLTFGRDGEEIDADLFNMAWLAVRGVGAINGVSRLHGEVSRRIFQPLFRRWPESEVPVGYVTNGVHTPSWDSAASDEMWTEACGKQRWRGELECIGLELKDVSDGALWQLRSDGRKQMLEYLRRRLKKQNRVHAYPDFNPESQLGFDTDALTLGFARRFAEYKRPDLLLHDQERLANLLTDRDRPVQLVVAGKAHPRDERGKAILRAWHTFIQRKDLAGRVVFIEDYDLVVAAELTGGVDLWINTPRRPWEASGTSGMKVLVNGGLNLSVLDGWWAEAYSPEVGWAIGDGLQHQDIAAWDARDAEHLYQVLENEVIPAFYERDEQGIPRHWVHLMRESMARLTGLFSSNRMLREYTESYYRPMQKEFLLRAGGKQGICEWLRKVREDWQHVHFGKLSVHETGQSYQFEVQVYFDDLDHEAVAVELYADQNSALQVAPARTRMTCGEPLVGANNAFTYHGEVPADRPVKDYTPRVIPYHEGVQVPLEVNKILWYH